MEFNIKLVGQLVTSFAIIVLGAIISAYTLATLWEWIITPIFGLGVITLGQSYAIGVFKSYILYKHSPSEESDDTFIGKLMQGVITLVLINLLFLFTGWIATLFI